MIQHIRNGNGIDSVGNFVQGTDAGKMVEIGGGRGGACRSRFALHDERSLQADFGPAGTDFNEPVYISLSYKSTDLSNVPDENALGIYYYNSSNGTWELISNNVNTVDKYVEGYINHFSRYAIGME